MSKAKVFKAGKRTYEPIIFFIIMALTKDIIFGKKAVSTVGTSTVSFTTEQNIFLISIGSVNRN